MMGYENEIAMLEICFFIGEMPKKKAVKGQLRVL